MSWKRDTQQLAVDAARTYYDNVLSRGRYPGEFNLYRNMSRTDAIMSLAKKYVHKLREKVPEDKYESEDFRRRVSNLDLGAVEKYMFEFGDDPFAASRRKGLEKLLSTSSPEDGTYKPGWYENWSPKELEAKMYEFGYEPSRPGDKMAFLKELSDLQEQVDRSNIVKNEINDASFVSKLGMAAYPTLTNEAIKQTLTGDYSNSRMYGALGLDVATGGLGMTIPALKSTVIAKPLEVGLYDAGAELVRQGVSSAAGLGNGEFSPSEVIAAGLSGAAVPKLATGAQTIVKGAISMKGRPLARGFFRGARGAYDPYIDERNSLKELLLKAREQSLNASKGKTATGTKPKSSYTLDELNEAKAWYEAEERLNSLGIPTLEKDYYHYEKLDEVNKRIEALQHKIKYWRPIDNPKYAELKRQNFDLDKVAEEFLNDPRVPESWKAKTRQRVKEKHDSVNAEIDKIIKSDPNYKATEMELNNAIKERAELEKYEPRRATVNIPEKKRGRPKKNPDEPVNPNAPQGYVEDYIGVSPRISNDLFQQQSVHKSDIPTKRIDELVDKYYGSTDWSWKQLLHPKKNPGAWTAAMFGVTDGKPFTFTPRKPGVLDSDALSESKPYVEALSQYFPEKYIKDAGISRQKNNRNWYRAGFAVGKTFSTVGNVFEPNLKINPVRPGDYDRKTKEFKESDWYKNLPKEKKNVIEKILKGE